MSIDGYSNSIFSRAEKFKICSENQRKLNLRLKEIAKEISELPQIPYSMDEWIESLPDIKTKRFGIDAFSKHFRYKKEYLELMDNSDSNLREMKIIAIEDLLDKINNTLNKSG